MTDIDLNSQSVEAWDISALIPYERNNKKHTPESVAKLAATMKARGQITPIVVDRDGVIIAGHGRRLAAIELGWAKIKVIQLDVDREEAQRMRLADNFATNTQFDWENIRADLEDMGDIDVDLAGGFGLNEKELTTLLPEDHGLDENIEAISENIEDDVDQFSEDNEQYVAEMDGKPVPVSKALGFPRVMPDQAIKIGRFLAVVKSETGQPDPLVALIQWIEDQDLA